MAHTPLIGSVIRLASQLRCARQLGLAWAQVEAQQEIARKNRTGLTRRQFLAGSLAATAGWGLAPWAWGSPSRQPSIAIIGAGLAGLNCALALADKGLRPSLYEASGRLGGRIFTQASYWAEEQVSEWCGELIDSNHATLRQLVKRFGLGLKDLIAAQPSGSGETFFFHGQYYPRAEAARDFLPVFDAVQADRQAAGESTSYQASTPAGRSLDHLSVWSWIEKRVPDGHQSRLGQLLDVAFTTEYGADTTEQSALNLIYTLAGSDRNFELFGASDERFHIQGGNQQLPQAMAAHLDQVGVPIQTGSRLAALSQTPDGRYRLALDSAAASIEVLADVVVLAIPFAVLRTLDCTGAGFDELKQKAIQDLGRGKSAKLQLQFRQRWWNEPGPWGASTGTTFASCGYQSTWEPTRGQSGKGGILNNYLGGTTVERLRTRAVFQHMPHLALRQDAQAFLDAAGAVFPGLPSRWNGKAAVSLPHLSPLFNCGYSYWKTGQYQSIAGYERVRQKNVFFAGEHTSLSYQGFMEGAAQEGQRAAREVLRQVGR